MEINPQILVLDDEKEIRDLVGRILKRKGYNYYSVANAEEAKNYLQSEKVDLVLCDIDMPGQSGLDFCRDLKTLRPDVAVVMVTGFDDPDIANRAIKAGAYGYVVKPIEPNDLLIYIDNVLHRIKLEKENEEALKDSEEMFRAISESANDAIVMINEQDEVTFWNRAAEQIFGYRRKDILGKRLHPFVVPEPLQERCHKGLKLFRKTGKGPAVGNTIEVSALRKDGREFPVELSLSGIRLKDCWHAVAIIRDISKRKKAEEALRQANADMEYLISSLSTILVELTPRLSIKRWNKVAEDIFELPRQEVVGRAFSQLPLNWEWEKVNEGISKCIDEKSVVPLRDIRMARVADRSRVLEITVTPKVTRDDEFIGLIILGSDITEWRKMENQLLQAQKLESIGQLAAGIAHEINTPTQFIRDNIQFLEESFEDFETLLNRYHELIHILKRGGDVKQQLDEIGEVESEIDLEYIRKEIPKAIAQSMDGVRRVAKIVKAMKEFSHPGNEEKTRVDINHAIKNTITVARTEWKYVAELETDLDSSLPRILCLPGELNQVLLNIIINAAHAIAEVVGNGRKGKGKITISTRKKEKWVEIRITDTGSGIPESIRSKIFDPFFTTKGVGKGTGQGLAIAHSIIVEKHNGSIEVETKEGKGTTFIIRLPIEND